MTEMKPYIKQWYDYLAEGKFMGLKCKRCGTIECPPYPICHECSCMDVEWVEMSGEAELITFGYSAMGNYPYTMDDVQCGWFKLKEGTEFCAQLMDPPEDQEALMHALPIKVKAEIICIEEKNNLYYPAFRIVE